MVVTSFKNNRLGWEKKEKNKISDFSSLLDKIKKEKKEQTEELLLRGKYVNSIWNIDDVEDWWKKMIYFKSDFYSGIKYMSFFDNAELEDFFWKISKDEKIRLLDFLYSLLDDKKRRKIPVLLDYFVQRRWDTLKVNRIRALLHSVYNWNNTSVTLFSVNIEKIKKLLFSYNGVIDLTI